MKKVLVFALVAIFALSLSSCGKKAKTNTEKLCIEKGWVLSKATSSPDYLMSDGSYASNLIEDGYLLDYELDDIIKFNANGNQVINGGKNVPEEGDYQASDKGVGTWEFAKDESVLKFQIPFFYDNEREEATVLELSETELRVKYTFNAVDIPTKEAYSFTLTYVPAK